MDNLESAYKVINSSFKKSLTFRLGYDAGFFSEYNNMVLAILYCLVNKYRFKLSSKKSNFSARGWQEFFLPFCEESNFIFHQYFNHRGHHLYSVIDKTASRIYKSVTGNLLTQDCWHQFHSQEFQKSYIRIPFLEIDGNLLSATKKIISLTWKYNNETKSRVNDIVNCLELKGRKYVGLHIRRGDKYTEAPIVNEIKYIETLKMHSKIKDVYVASDDYKVFKRLKANYPEYNFYTLATESSSGFLYKNYESLNNIQKKELLLSLFADIELLAGSEYFIGTFSSNIGSYLCMRRGGENVCDVNLSEWLIW